MKCAKFHSKIIHVQQSLTCIGKENTAITDIEKTQSVFIVCQLHKWLIFRTIKIISLSMHSVSLKKRLMTKRLTSPMSKDCKIRAETLNQLTVRPTLWWFYKSACAKAFAPTRAMLWNKYYQNSKKLSICISILYLTSN